MAKRPSRKDFAKKWKDIETVSKVFLGMVSFEAFLILAFATYYLITSGSSTISSKFSTALLIILTMILLYFAFDAVLEENACELLAFEVVSFMILIRVIFNFVQSWSSSTSQSLDINVLAPMALALFFQSLFAYLGWKVFQTFGWQVFQVAGANLSPSKLERVRTYLQYLSFIKVDSQFVVSLGLMGFFFIQFEVLTYVALSVCLAISVIFAFLSVWAIKVERRWVLIMIMVWNLVLPGYVIYKVDQMYHENTEEFWRSAVDVQSSRSSLVVTIAFFLVFRCVVEYYLGHVLYRATVYPDISDDSGKPAMLGSSIGAGGKAPPIMIDLQHISFNPDPIPRELLPPASPGPMFGMSPPSSGGGFHQGSPKSPPLPPTPKSPAVSQLRPLLYSPADSTGSPQAHGSFSPI